MCHDRFSNNEIFFIIIFTFALASVFLLCLNGPIGILDRVIFCNDHNQSRFIRMEILHTGGFLVMFLLGSSDDLVVEDGSTIRASSSQVRQPEKRSE